MAVKPIRPGLELPAESTEPETIEFLEELLRLAREGNLSAFAIAYVLDGDPSFVYAHDGDALTLSGATHALALQITNEVAFDE